MSTLSDLTAVAPELQISGADASYKGQGYGPYARKPNARGRVSRQGAEETLSFWLKAENFARAVDIICGQPTSAVILGVPVVRIVPLLHPYLNNLFADDVSWELFGEGGSHVTGHTHARITVTFRSLNYVTTGFTPYCEVRTHPTSRNIPTPASAWSVGGAAPFRDPDYDVGGSEIEFVMHHCPATTPGQLNTYANYILQEIFLNCPVGCTRFNGGKLLPTSQVSTAGQSISLSFSTTAAEVPWNYYSAADGSLSALTRSGGSVFRYPSISIGTILGGI